MASVKVKFRPSVKSDCEGTVYYQLIHNRVVRQLKTGYKVFPEEWDNGNGMIACVNDRKELGSIQEYICRDLKRLSAIIKRFDNNAIRYTVDDIINDFKNQSHKHSFFCFMRGIIHQLNLLNRQRTAENYVTTMNSFTNFRENDDLLFNEINSDLMMRYEAYLIDRGITKNTISFYMRILRAVYNRAVDQELTEQKYPFKRVYTGIDKTVKRAIPFSAIKRIKELDLQEHPVLDFSRDMFMFSFYTRGMSFIDMAYLKKTDLRHGIITYRRRKTRQQLSIKWEKCMQAVVAKYEQNGFGSQSQHISPYLLPILKHPFDNSSRQYRTTLQLINNSLKTVAKMAKLNIPLTMYVARHSWASIAKSKKIPVSIISEGMGHDSEATTQIYLASLDTSVVDRANNVVLKGL